MRPILPGWTCLLAALLLVAASRALGAPLRIVVNIPARRLRAYRAEKRVMDVPAGIGKLHYAGHGRDTRTAVGRHTLASWHHNYRNRRWPVPWSRDPEQGVFGPWTAKARGDRFYHHIHGTTGPMELGDAPLQVAPSPGTGRAEGRWEYGFSHGCVRLANRDITALHELCPVGTLIERIYCLTERFPDGKGGHREERLPNVYGYRKVAEGAVFHPLTGRLEGYAHPGDARGP